MAKPKYVLILVAALVLSVDAHAAVVSSKGTPSCGANCAWSVSVDGQQASSGTYAVDAVTGNISLGPAFTMDLGGGAFVNLNSLSGNIDPILGFSVAAGTGAAGRTFAFAFSLPIALSGPLQASSSVSYSLTSLTAAGAQVTPFLGTVVVAQDVDTSAGGLSPLDKGVNVGAAYVTPSGPATTNSQVFTASRTLTGDLAYDLMSVTLAFALSADSQVGMSGFVQQQVLDQPAAEAPLPTAAWLLVGGLGFFGPFSRHALSAGAG